MRRSSAAGRFAVFGVVLALAIVVVAGEMSGTMLGRGPFALNLGQTDWWAMLATLGLTGVFRPLWRATPRAGCARAGASGGRASLGGRDHALVVGRWLLAVCGPPGGAALYYPLATAAAGLATARVVWRHAHFASWHELAWLGDLRFESMSRLLSIQACVLTGVAVIFTKGSVEASTALTLLLASLTLGPVALATGWQASALAGSLAWSATWGVAGMVIAERLGFHAGELRATWPPSACCLAILACGPGGVATCDLSGLKSAGTSGAGARPWNLRYRWPGRWRSSHSPRLCSRSSSFWPPARTRRRRS